jgi:K+-sensing histidine kinase KdpD
MTTIYRNYLIARVGDKYVAKSGDEDCILVSTTQRRLYEAIDDLWLSLEKGAEPAWFTGSSAIDLDTFGPESVPSSSDPPATRVRPGAYRISYLTFALTAFCVAAPLSYIMEMMCFPKQVDVMLTVGVCAVAVAFGKRYALIAAAIATIVFNFIGVEPILSFSIPTAGELAFASMNILVAIGIPELLRMRFLQCLQGRGRTPNT